VNEKPEVPQGDSEAAKSRGAMTPPVASEERRHLTRRPPDPSARPACTWVRYIASDGWGEKGLQSGG